MTNYAFYAVQIDHNDESQSVQLFDDPAEAHYAFHDARQAPDTEKAVLLGFMHPYHVIDNFPKS